MGYQSFMKNGRLNKIAPEFSDGGQQVRAIIRHALQEDIGTGDITTEILIPESVQGRMLLVARERLVACGAALVSVVFEEMGEPVQCDVRCKDGQVLASGDVMVELIGRARALLTGERVALNLLQRMCGVATETARYVAELEGTKARLLDTRKTMPGLRILDKYAVRAGGGCNHRMRLDDMVLVKDNHIALCGGIAGAVAKARSCTPLPVVVECDTLMQVREALAAKPDRILLDNMSLEDLRSAVKICGGQMPLEASGGVGVHNIAAIARTGVDFISVGSITHSARACDVGADILLET